MPEEKVNLPRNIDGSREVRGQILSRYDSGTLCRFAYGLWSTQGVRHMLQREGMSVESFGLGGH